MSLLSSQALQLRQMLSAAEIDNTIEHIDKLYVAQLKELCKSLLLPLKGKRQELIDKLEQHVRQCQVTGQNVRLLALRTIVLKMMTNDPLPNFDNLYGALQSGLIDASLMSDQLARLQQLANQIKGKPRGSGAAIHGSGEAGHRVSLHAKAIRHDTTPYNPHYKGPMLLFQGTIFYSLRRMLRRFPFMIPASKGRNLSNITIRLDESEIALLKSDPHMRLYLFSGLLSDKEPSRADIQFPPIEIHVDGINTKQYVKGLKGKAGTCRPADLTDYVKTSKAFTVNIVYSDAAEPYLLYVYVVDARSPEEIVKYISTEREHILVATTKMLIAKDYEQNLDDEIVMATSSLSLRCPLTYAKLAVPMRSTLCDHVQCFDGLLFLTMQERIPSWVCPVCSKHIDPHTLAMSDYLQDILDHTSEDVDTVNINLDGSWEAVHEEALNDDDDDDLPPMAKEASAPQEEAIEVISLDSDSEDEQPDVSMRSAPEVLEETMEDATEEARDAEGVTGNAEGEADGNATEHPAEPAAPAVHLPAPKEASETPQAASEQNTATTTHNTLPPRFLARSGSQSSDDQPIHIYRRRSRITEDEENDTMGLMTSPRITHSDVERVDSSSQPVSHSHAASSVSSQSQTERNVNGQSLSTATESIGAEPATQTRSTSPQGHQQSHEPTQSLSAPPVEPHAHKSHQPQETSETSELRQETRAHTNRETHTASTDADVSIVSIETASPKQNHGDSLETPKAKRLKIPTDSNFSLIDNICQTISRPSSTDPPAQQVVPQQVADTRLSPVSNANALPTPPAPNAPADNRHKSVEKVPERIPPSVSPATSTSPTTSVTPVGNLFPRSPTMNKNAALGIVPAQNVNSKQAPSAAPPNGATGVAPAPTNPQTRGQGNIRLSGDPRVTMGAFNSLIVNRDLQDMSQYRAQQAQYFENSRARLTSEQQGSDNGASMARQPRNDFVEDVMADKSWTGSSKPVAYRQEAAQHAQHQAFEPVYSKYAQGQEPAQPQGQSLSYQLQQRQYFQQALHAHQAQQAYRAQQVQAQQAQRVQYHQQTQHGQQTQAPQNRFVQQQPPQQQQPHTHHTRPHQLTGFVPMVRPPFTNSPSPTETLGSEHFRRLVLSSTLLINRYRAEQNQASWPANGAPSPQIVQRAPARSNTDTQIEKKPSQSIIDPPDPEASRDAGQRPFGNPGSTTQTQPSSSFGYFPNSRPIEGAEMRRATTGAVSGARYSRSPFDVLDERRIVTKVKGLLDIEVSLDILTGGGRLAELVSTSSAPSTVPPTPVHKALPAPLPHDDQPQNPGQAQLTPRVHSTPQLHTEMLAQRQSEPQDQAGDRSEVTPAGRQALESGQNTAHTAQNADKSMTMSPLDNKIQVMTLTTPSNAKRVISHEGPQERTWNKRLSSTGSKNKFDPSTVSQTSIINLDDE